MTEQQAAALFLLAGFEVSKLYRFENQYWPEAYVDERKNSPWWLATTKYGAIKIGWRKRVISINWEDTQIRIIATEDNVTKEDTYVHAWSYVKALQYLTAVRDAATREAVIGERSTTEQRLTLRQISDQYHRAQFHCADTELKITAGELTSLCSDLCAGRNEVDGLRNEVILAGNREAAFRRANDLLKAKINAMEDCIGVEEGQSYEERAEELIVTEVDHKNQRAGMPQSDALDAERYRWVRASESPTLEVCMVELPDHGGHRFLEGEELDAAIDSARGAKPPVRTITFPDDMTMAESHGDPGISGETNDHHPDGRRKGANPLTAGNLVARIAGVRPERPLSMSPWSVGWTAEMKREVVVCDACERACCIQGEFMCDSAQMAGTKRLPVHDLTTKPRGENAEYWFKDSNGFIDRTALEAYQGQLSERGNHG